MKIQNKENVNTQKASYKMSLNSEKRSQKRMEIIY